MKSKHIKSIVLIILLLLMLSPVFMRLGWKYSKKINTNILVLDKTVLNHNFQEHVSFYWVLNNCRFVKPDSSIFSPMDDYYGFFPDEKGAYKIKDLESKDKKELEQLSSDYDMLVYTDAYGIYWAEWYNEYPSIKTKLKVGDRSPLIYGGLSKNELELLILMKNKKKLIVNEFNIIASPTPNHLRKQYEEEFDINWSGWVGRYYDNLDTTINRELPGWLINNYKKQYNGHWPFTQSGIVFVRNDDRIVILENQTHLDNDLPIIVTNPDYIKPYGLPKTIEYSFWFDICSAGPKNDIISEYHIESNPKGDSTLNLWNIPKVFPAVIKRNQDYPYYYFAGDFSDNNISMKTSYYKYIEKVDFLFFDSKIDDRNEFFWIYYRPLMSKILKDYYKQ